MRLSLHLLAPALLPALLVGCTSMGQGSVAIRQEPGCFKEALPATWALAMEDMPGFFAPIMEDGVSLAMQARGLTYVEEAADLTITIRYEQLDLNLPPPRRDPLESGTGHHTAAEFMARVEITATSEAGEHWAGTLARTHRIDGNETVHRPRATLMIVGAIDQMFTGFPALCEPESKP